MIKLVHVADLTVAVAPPIEIGTTPEGLRQLIPTGGEAVPSVRYAIQTDGGATISIENTRLRQGPADAMERLQRGEEVVSELIYFRTTPRFETAAESYLRRTLLVFVAEGARRPDRVEFTAYRIP